MQLLLKNVVFLLCFISTNFETEEATIYVSKELDLYVIIVYNNSTAATTKS